MNTSCIEEKSQIRREMRARRAALTPEENSIASSVICKKLMQAIEEHGSHFSREGKAVCVYLASSKELDLSNFILPLLERNIKVLSPQWNGKTYSLAEIKSLQAHDLRTGPMGILEPAQDEEISPSEVGAWIIPALALTTSGKRLGYGGGWYDRLLAQANKDALKIGVAHDFQVVSDLPSEPHDILLDAVIDTKDLYFFRRS